MSRVRFRAGTQAMAACVIAAACLSAPSAASANTPATDTPRPDEGTPTASREFEDPAVLSLVAEYGLSTEQAHAQMETQVAAGRAERDLPPALSMTYSGRQVSHDRGGAVAVAISDPTFASVTRDHFAGYGIDNLDVRIVVLTQTEIHEVIDQLRELLRAG